MRLGALTAALALGAAACGGGSGDGADVAIEATPAALADAAQRSTEESFRMEMAMSLGDGPSVPVATGAMDGDRFEMTMDLGATIAAFGE